MIGGSVLKKMGEKTKDFFTSHSSGFSQHGTT